MAHEYGEGEGPVNVEEGGAMVESLAVAKDIMNAILLEAHTLFPTHQDYPRLETLRRDLDKIDPSHHQEMQNLIDQANEILERIKVESDR